MRRIALAAVALAMGASTLLLAGPAQAADSVVDCDSDGARTVNVTLVIGGTYTIENSNVSDYCIVTGAGVSVSWEVAGGPSNPTNLLGAETMTVTGRAAGSETLTLRTDSLSDVVFIFTIISGDAGGSTSSAPPPLIQQFGRPISGTCDAAAPEDLNWSGVASGGWGESWAHWINSGKGGDVCTRTLIYSTVQSKWVVD